MSDVKPIAGAVLDVVIGFAVDKLPPDDVGPFVETLKVLAHLGLSAAIDEWNTTRMAAKTMVYADNT